MGNARDLGDLDVETGANVVRTSPDPLAAWPSFAEAVRARLEKGQAEYGDASFQRPPEELAAEIEEELADVCGWAFVLWCRVRRLREAVERGATPSRRKPDSGL